MKFFSARRGMLACIVSAATVAALVAPGVASAEIKIAQCKGSALEGAGSSLQAEAQAVWVKTFHTTTAKTGCPGENPVVKYASTSSGKGYNAWAKEGKYGTFGFIGTDNTANEAEINTINSQAEGEKTSKLLTIPVLQSALAVVVNLPAGCTAESHVAKGRLALNEKTLEEVYTGKITTWDKLLGANEPGTENALKGCTEEPSKDKITPVVREDSSGTTHIFKKFLGIVNNPEISAGEKFPSEDGLEHNWGELAEGTTSTLLEKIKEGKEEFFKYSQLWPTAAHVKRATTSGNPGVLKTVGATPGSIGYANLADTRNPANGNFAKGGSEFWVELENSSKETSKGPKRKYADPSEGGFSETPSNSNCKKTVFVNGKKAFPPPTLEGAWNEVTADTVSKTYALCGLTYDFALTKYSQYHGKGATEEEAASVRDYLKYLTDKKGGQADMTGHDYLQMPKELLNEDKAGLEKIDY